MLDEKDFNQIRDYVIRILPELLRTEPEIATTIEGILAQHFPRRDEFARLLDELKLLREEMNQRFEQVDHSVLELRHDIAELQQGQLELRRDVAELQQGQLELRRDVAELQQGQLELKRDVAELQQGQLELRRDVAKLQHGQEMMLKQMTGQDAWLRLVTGNLRSEKGRTLEDMFALALRYGLKNPDIAPDTIQLCQKLIDPTGQVFKPGLTTEVDLIAEDDKLIVFEVKATAEGSDVDTFALKVELVSLQNPDRLVRGTFISPAAGEDVQQRCAEHGLELVD